jgi:hypothetical protein
MAFAGPLASCGSHDIRASFDYEGVSDETSQSVDAANKASFSENSVSYRCSDSGSGYLSVASSFDYDPLAPLDGVDLFALSFTAEQGCVLTDHRWQLLY